jgi:hypothetical protein
VLHFEKRSTSSAQNNQIDLFAASVEDDLFGGISLQCNLGYVSSTWKDGDGPARRNYSLTRVGQTHLRDWAHLLEALGREMIAFHREVTARQDA